MRSSAMKSACGEYECPCHDELPLVKAERDALKAKLAASEAARAETEKNAVFAVSEHMAVADYTQERLKESEAARLKAEVEAAVSRKAAAGLVELLESHGWGEGPALRYARSVLATDAGQHVTDYIAAARRLRDKLNTSKMLVDHAGEVALAIADVDAADAKLQVSK